MKKTMSFAALHFSVAFAITYLLTGEILLASLVAMIEPMANTVAFYFHDRIWAWRHHASMTTQMLRIKTASFATVHFSVAFGVGYLLSGDLLVGSAIALLEPTVNTIVYYFHEKVWEERAQPVLQA
ncbi:DUF2061 domain-containing protein [Thaumasiovibrio subtropicus]|uniref:DUF2061 domain-containing protein n=1 Tax=Thaumasiovibrio subtropicus TaxID=1891207 RepID=UPI000B358B76|nr:DUF2061 domain-containing protein [Thaumasiovibrio subtropicus]